MTMGIGKIPAPIHLIEYSRLIIRALRFVAKALSRYWWLFGVLPVVTVGSGHLLEAHFGEYQVTSYLILLQTDPANSNASGYDWIQIASGILDVQTKLPEDALAYSLNIDPSILKGSRISTSAESIKRQIQVNVISKSANSAAKVANSFALTADGRTHELFPGSPTLGLLNRVDPNDARQVLLLLGTSLSSKFLNKFVQAGIGIAFALAIALMRVAGDQRVGFRREEFMEELKVRHIPVLGLIPQLPFDTIEDWSRVFQGNGPRPAFFLRLEFLRTNLKREMERRGSCKTIVVTSQYPGEGKTIAAAFLAIACSESWKSVVLVDCDLRRSRLHQYFELSQTPGLGNLENLESKALEDFLQKTQHPNLRVLTAGPLPPEPIRTFESLGFSNLLKRLRDQADVVVLDSPPIGVVADAAVIGNKTDSVLMVVNARTDLPRAIVGLDTMRDEGRRDMIGVVIQGVRGNTDWTDKMINRLISYTYYPYYPVESAPKRGLGNVMRWR